MNSTTIEDMIRTGIPDADVQVRDVRGDGLSFDATVTCTRFEGMTRIQQHRLVHHTLDRVIGNDLHAFRLTTRTT